MYFKILNTSQVTLSLLFAIAMGFLLLWKPMLSIHVREKERERERKSGKETTTFSIYVLYAFFLFIFPNNFVGIRYHIP